jgi:hypothetical protein
LARSCSPMWWPACRGAAQPARPPLSCSELSDLNPRIKDPIGRTPSRESILGVGIVSGVWVHHLPLNEPTYRSPTHYPNNHPDPLSEWCYRSWQGVLGRSSPSDFEAWADDLDQQDAEALLAAIRILRDAGPTLGRPLVDTIKGSRHANMKELRPGSPGRTEIRVLFAFDLKQSSSSVATRATTGRAGAR